MGDHDGCNARADPVLHELEYILSILSLLPALHTMKLSWRTANTLFASRLRWPLVDGDDPADSFRWEGFRAVALRIASLTLYNFEVLETRALLAAFVGLRSLRVKDVDEDEFQSVFPSVAQGLMNPHLAFFSVNVIGPELVKTWSSGGVATPPPSIIHLEIHYSPDVPLDLAAISPFAPTLETLQVQYTRVAPLDGRPVDSFPHLHTLSLRYPSEDPIHSPSLLSHLTTPALIFLRYSHTYLAIPDLSLPSFTDFLAANPQLRHLTFPHTVNPYTRKSTPRLPPLEIATRLIQSSPNLSLAALDEPHLGPFWFDADLSHTESNLASSGTPSGAP